MGIACQSKYIQMPLKTKNTEVFGKAATFVAPGFEVEKSVGLADQMWVTGLQWK